MDRDLEDLLVSGARDMGIKLGTEEVGRFSVYLGLLQAWGAKINLTSRLGSREIVTYHFLDSLSGADHVSDPPGARVIDIGSGAGLPGIPLRIALPGLKVLIVDGSKKKVAFCREVLRQTGLGDIELEWGRAEEIAKRSCRRRGFDWAVSRAVGSSAEVSRIAEPFLAEGGRILLYKGAPDEAEIAELDRYCTGIGATWSSRRTAVPGVEGARTHIVVSGFPDR